MDLSVCFNKIRFPNPVLLASGILGVTKSSLKNVISHGAGGCVIKSVSLEPRAGHSGPNIITFEAGVMNAVGYSNAGLSSAKKEFKSLKELKAPVIASIIGQNEKEFARMAEELLPGDFAAVELALSCPHTPGYGTLSGQNSPDNTEKITRAVREKTRLPVWVKLSPNSPHLGEVGKAAEAGGADAIVAVNTLGPGMIIDINTAKPVIGFKIGGVSGPALRPIAVRCVYDLFEAVKIPIVGVGGVSRGKDAVEMMMAGASAVQIGSGVYYRGLDVFKKVNNEISKFMAAKKIKLLKSIVGQAHE